MKYRSKEIKDIYYYDGDIKKFIEYFNEYLSAYKIFTGDNKEANIEIWSKKSSNSKLIHKDLYISHNNNGFQAWHEDLMKDWERLE